MSYTTFTSQSTSSSRPTKKRKQDFDEESYELSTSGSGLVNSAATQTTRTGTSATTGDITITESSQRTNSQHDQHSWRNTQSTSNDGSSYQITSQPTRNHRASQSLSQSQSQFQSQSTSSGFPDVDPDSGVLEESQSQFTDATHDSIRIKSVSEPSNPSQSQSQPHFQSSARPSPMRPLRHLSPSDFRPFLPGGTIPTSSIEQFETPIRPAAESIDEWSSHAGPSSQLLRANRARHTENLQNRRNTSDDSHGRVRGNAPRRTLHEITSMRQSGMNGHLTTVPETPGTHNQLAADEYPRSLEPIIAHTELNEDCTIATHQDEVNGTSQIEATSTQYTIEDTNADEDRVYEEAGPYTNATADENEVDDYWENTPEEMFVRLNDVEVRLFLFD
jgi:hypothetical protein